MRIIRFNKKGVSLPLVIGLVALLMVASAAVNELIIRTLRSVHQIEASNRAYLAAEAGIEDALYELAPHFSGYETDDVRIADFVGNVRWESEWEIQSKSGFQTFTGRLVPDQKLVIPLYNDTSQPETTPLASNAINDTPLAAVDITPLDVSNKFSVTIALPKELVSFHGLDNLAIDNDEDEEVNEDWKDEIDNDSDGDIDEDSDEDTVVFWKLTDGANHSLIPLQGCIDDGSSICEKDFLGAKLSVTLNETHVGEREVGSTPATQPIKDFISEFQASNAKLQIEFLIVAPLRHDAAIDIPYLEYEVESDSTDIPLPYFTIQSDGFYRDFKQSITTTITPKTTVPLFDFTIIQQQ